MCFIQGGHKNDCQLDRCCFTLILIESTTCVMSLVFKLHRPGLFGGLPLLTARHTCSTTFRLLFLLALTDTATAWSTPGSLRCDGRMNFLSLVLTAPDILLAALWLWTTRSPAMSISKDGQDKMSIASHKVKSVVYRSDVLPTFLWSAFLSSDQQLFDNRSTKHSLISYPYS